MNIVLILKGFIVGIGKIIPGVSGSMLAMTLGIYESIIKAVTSFFNNPKENFNILFNFCLGLFIAIIFFSNFLSFLLRYYYGETMYLFLGLIIGTLVLFTKKVQLNRKNILIFSITLIIIFLITFLFNFFEVNIINSMSNFFYISFLGVIDAATSIIPGISGTAIFMLLGSYDLVLTILANPFSNEIIIYGIGLVFGFIIVCFLMKYLISKKSQETYSVILALMFFSIFILFLDLIKFFKLPFMFLFLIGVVIGYIFDKN